MSEQILKMSGDFHGEFESYQNAGHSRVESVATTIVECGTVNCTVILC
jgi:hypothetical protein